MARNQGGDKRRERGAMGTDDIQRGNVGTADQGPGDVAPSGKVDAHTGEIEPRPMARKPAKKR
jgi:hypothetical protein